MNTPTHYNTGDGDLDCDHGAPDIPFDEKAAEKMTAYEVRKYWPRRDGPCPKGCGWHGIAYASFAHYIAGDW